MSSDIAVIGIGCRFPGADDIEEFWQVLVNGENHVVNIPADRWNNQAFFSENKEEKGKLYVRKAAFLKRHDEWDNKFFGLSDYEASQVDPQQRYVLECTHMAFEDGGLTSTHIRGSNTGVFIGCMSQDYSGLYDFDHRDDTSHTITGTNTAIISSRVSYVYDLRGPCMVVNTACSSSMTAIHLACQAIITGDCEMAVCGGVGSILTPDIFIAACKAGIMSSEGQCQAFCDSADGYVRGEGCGILVLKTLEQAVKDNNKIWGIIRTGLNQDGHVAQPITAPAGTQQEQLLERLYRKYSINPSNLQYIECHGTGTPVGDPIEVNALGRMIRSYIHDTNSDKIDELNETQNDRKSHSIKHINQGQTEMNGSDTTYSGSKILIGSVKTNIGHLEAAAGVAGIIKVLLMMHHGMFVPSLHAKIDKSNWNKTIKFGEYGLDISVKVQPWNKNENGERLGCVNSFGFGGSNSHCIVIQRNSHQDMATENREHQIKLICVTAIDRLSLLYALEKLDNDLEKTNHTLQDVSFSSLFHRNHYRCRVLLFGKNKAEIRSQISKQIVCLENPEAIRNNNIVFVFCGMGTAWTGMCQDLMKEQSTFRETIQDIDNIMEEFTGFRMEDKFQNDTVYNDPFLDALAIFYVQIGLYHVWKSWGILPNAVIGQSVGEVAAAYASGALTLRDATKVIYVRSKYVSCQAGGKMMVVGNFSEDLLRDLCKRYENKVDIAGFQSPTSFTLSGDADVMEKIKSDLVEISRNYNENVLIRPLAVNCAYHSHHMDQCLDDIEAELKGLSGGKMVCRHLSTVSGMQVEGNVFINGQYWKENVRLPVKFRQAILNSTIKESTTIFIEVGPKPVLRTHMKTIFTDQQTCISVQSMAEKSENPALYSALGKLFKLGVDISWSNIVPPFGCIVPTPRYIFHKSKNMFVPHHHRALLKALQTDSSSHMFLVTGEKENEDYCINVNKISTPFVFDHFFFDSVLLPGVTYVEAGFEIGVRKTNLNRFEIEIFVDFMKKMTADREENQTISISVDEGNQAFIFTAKHEGKTLCSGKISARAKTIEKQQIEINDVKDRCKRHLDKKACYTCLANHHFQYGKSLQVIEEAWSSEKECLGRIHLPDSVMKESKHTNFHPSAMDAMMQTVATMGTTHDGFSVPHLPKMLGSVVINGSIQQSMYGYSHMIKYDEEGFHFNCLLLCPNGRIIAEIRNYYYQKMNLDLPSPMNVSFNEVKWCLTKTTIPKYSFGDQNQETAQVAFLCTKRFAESMSEVNKKIADVNVLSEASSENKELLDKWLSKPSLKTIVYAPCQHIEERGQLGCEIIEITKGSCLTLQYLLQYIENSHLSVTVYVITESVWSTSFVYQEMSNIFGSELWGMVRSAMLELPNIELRLVDMDLCKKNMDALQGILHDGQNKIKEFLLRDGKVFHCQVSEYNNENDIQPRIDIMFDGTDEVVLKSKNPAVIKMPYFEILRRDKKPRLTSNCQLMLNDVCLHDPSLYPITSEFLNTDESVWPEDSETGFKVMCLEGSGFKISSHDQDNRKPRIGFCFPLEVTSIVSVPKECMFEIDEIPCYLPGMVTVGLILWDIVQNIDTSKHTCVVVNEDSNIWVQLVKHLLSLRNLTRLFILKKEDIWLSNYTDLENIILLSAITHNQMKDIIAKCPSIKSIITTENYMSIHVKVWLEQNVKGIDVVILNVEKILDPHTLRHTVFPVCNALRTFNKKFSISEITHEQEERSSNTDMLNLPFHVLSISAQNKVKKRIPLKVDSCSLFRKTGCYIVVGGLTGLGWELVQYMAELGAGYIATFSRRKAPKEKEDQIKVTQMKESCRIIEIQVDITCIKSLQMAVKMLQEQIGSATIRGVFHGGAVLNDKLLKQMSEKDIEDPLLPKVLGTWNLHVATQDCPLDFFVMHSSIAAVFGSHGQCNYAAGNSFEDSFAHYRRQLGLCGQSVNWGALSVGMALSDTRFENYWKSLGFYVLTKEDIRRCFLKIIMGNYVQIVCGKFDWVKLNEGQMVALQPQKYDSFVEKFSGNANKTQTQEHNFCFDEFSRHDEQGKYKMVYDLTKSLLTEVIVTERTTLQEDTTFLSVGVDSMSAMSLINMLYDLVHVRIPLENLLKGSSCLKSLTTYIIQNITCKTSISANLGEQNEYPLYVKFEEFLADEITFIQRYILEKLAGGTNEAHYIVQVAFEIQGVEIPTEYFRSTVKAVCRRHQELRRIYIKKDDELYTTKVLRGEEIAVDVKEIDNIDFEADIRECVHFDLAKDLQVKFMIAAKNGTTRVLAFCHAITFDLASMEPFFKELGICLQSRNLEEPVRFAAHTESVAEVLSNAILPKATELWQYWNRQMNQDVRPLTLGQTLTENLTEKKMRQILVNVPSALLERINSFIQKRGMSLYEYLVSAYFATLHKITKEEVFPLVARVDLRVSIPQLHERIARCVNNVPLIGNFKHFETVNGFLEKMCIMIREATKYSLCPFSLIIAAAQNEELQKHMSKHEIVYDNMTNLHKTLTRNKFFLESSIFQVGYSSGTLLAIEHDTNQKYLKLVFKYGNQVVTEKDASNIMERLLYMMQTFLTNEETEIHELIGRQDKIEILAASDPLERNAIKIKDGELACGHQYLIRCDTFIEQTSHGNDEAIQLQIVKETLKSGDADIFLVWRKLDGSLVQELSVNMISEVAAKEEKDQYYIMLRTFQRWFVFKTSSRDSSVDWLHTFKDVVETVRPRQMNDLIFHL